MRLAAVGLPLSVRNVIDPARAPALSEANAHRTGLHR